MLVAQLSVMAARPGLPEDVRDALSDAAAALTTLQDPVAVHLNMVAGKIAKPLPTQLIHIYGEEAIRSVINDFDARV